MGNVDSAYDMWIAIKNIFQRRTLPNLLNARQKFSALNLFQNESVFSYINLAKQFCTELKAVNATVTEQVFAMTVLCGLPSRYEHLIVAIDAVADLEKLILEFAKCRLILKEHRITERSILYRRKPEFALLEELNCVIPCDKN